MDNEKLFKIKVKVSKLIRLANDNIKDSEGQTALVNAKKLMAKYHLDEEDINGVDETIYRKHVFNVKSIKKYSPVSHLASVIAENFRVMLVINKHFTNNKEIIYVGEFVGSSVDVSFAFEMYINSWKLMNHHADIEVPKRILEINAQNNYNESKFLRDSYTKGFVKGLQEKFNSAENDTKDIAIMNKLPDSLLNLIDSVYKSNDKTLEDEVEVEMFYRGTREGSKEISKGYIENEEA